jgi:hypothetical protein
MFPLTLWLALRTSFSPWADHFRLPLFERCRHLFMWVPYR